MAQTKQLEIVHDVPGRIRLRCAGLRESPSAADEIRALAQTLPGIEDVSIRPETGSVVLRYSLEDTDPASFRAALRAHVELTAAPPPKGAPPIPLGEEMIHAVRNFWAGTDSTVRRATGNTLDFRSTVPWVFMFVGLRQVSTRADLAALPWYTAFYHSLQTIFLFRDEPPAPGQGQDELLLPDIPFVDAVE